MDTTLRAFVRHTAMTLICCSVVLATGSASLTPYVAEPLTLGGSYAWAIAVNDNGQVAGTSYTSDNSGNHPFLWTRPGGYVDLGTLGGSTAVAYALSANGQVVGQSTTAGDVAYHAFSWTPVTGMIDLGTLGDGRSGANGVNANGQVIGNFDIGEYSGHSFSWTQSGGMVDLGTLGGSVSNAVALNDAGQVVGYSQTTAGGDHAFVWTQASGMIDLGTLGGTASYALSVNSHGQVVGYSTTAGEAALHAFSWTQAGGMVDLGITGRAIGVNDNGQVIGQTSDNVAFSWTPDGGIVRLTLGGDYSAPIAVNGNGQVIGYSSLDPFSGASHAFSWTRDGGIVDLSTLFGTFSRPYSVNVHGQIVGQSSTSDSTYAGVLWDSAGTPLSTKTQAMSGDLKVMPGSTLSVGYDFTMPGNHPAATLAFRKTTATFLATCTSGTRASTTIVVNIPNQSYVDPAGSTAWYPSPDAKSPSTFQGSVAVPSFCDPGALVSLKNGGTFSTYIKSTDTADPVSLRWHYVAGSGGKWSATYSVIPSE